MGSGLARLNPDGSLDAGFNPPARNYLDSHPVILLQPDGKVLAIDDYGILKRYNADGSVDPAYTAYGGSFSTRANAAVLQPDGKLVIVGSASAGGLVRLNRDGTIDTSFDLPDPNETGGIGGPSGLSGLDLEVGSLALQPDGKLLVGGSSQLASPLARLNPDGSLDETFPVSTILPKAVGAMAPEADAGFLLSAGYLCPDGKDIVHTVFAKLAGTFQGATVTLSASVPKAGGASAQTGEFLLTIPAAQSTDLNVAYQVKGSGINGTDYAYLTGTVKIKAGKTSKVIKVVPQGNLGGSTRKTVKLVIAPGAGYTVGPMNAAKVTITGPAH